MDQIKIGNFIAERRKSVNLTQMQLAELLSVTDRAVSKWERGKCMPDSSIMLKLCELLKITVTDLLTGEIINMENHDLKKEQALLELVKQKEQNDKQLLALEIVIGTISVLFLLSLTFIAAYLQMQDWLRVVLIVSGFVVCLIGIGFALRIEQTAGYYECQHCHHKYVPSYSSVLWAMHFGRTRLLKCPKCGKWTWNKKTIKKD